MKTISYEALYASVDVSNYKYKDARVEVLWW
jgi:hypothetical protein